MFINWDLSGFFFSFLITLGSFFLEGKTTKVMSHLHHIMWRVRTVNMTHHCWCDLDHLAEGVFVISPHCKVTFLSPFPCSAPLGEKSPSMRSPHPRSEGLCPSARAQYLHKLFALFGVLDRDLPLFPHVLIQSCIHISMNSWIFLLYFGL